MLDTACLLTRLLPKWTKALCELPKAIVRCPQTPRHPAGMKELTLGAGELVQLVGGLALHTAD